MEKTIEQKKKIVGRGKNVVSHKVGNLKLDKYKVKEIDEKITKLRKSIQDYTSRYLNKIIENLKVDQIDKSIELDRLQQEIENKQIELVELEEYLVENSQRERNKGKLYIIDFRKAD